MAGGEGGGTATRVTAWPSVTVLLASAPPIAALVTYGPDTPWGSVSSALSQSGSIVPPLLCVLGLAVSQLLHLALSGRSYPLLVLPVYAAAVLTTYTGMDTGVDDDCGALCAWHALAVWVLVALETYVLLVYVRVSGWLLWPVLAAFVIYAIVYHAVLDNAEFDETDTHSAYFVRSAGVLQLLGFLGARMLTAETLRGPATHVTHVTHAVL